MKKRFCNLLMVMILIVSAVPVMASADTTECDHNWGWTDGIAATCTTPGRKSGYVCQKCSEPKKASYVIEALGHDFENGVCSVCGYECEHDFDENCVCTECELACEHEAFENGFCTVCGADTSKCNHNWRWADGIAATCTTPGRSGGYVCQKCSEPKKASYVIEALGHDLKLEEYITEPTCTADGRGNFLCTRCNKYKEMDVPKYGHAFTEYRVEEATCTTYGRIFRLCERCNLIETERNEPLGHTEVVLEAVEATCSTTGLSEGKMCSSCDEILIEQEVIPMLAHSWQSYEAKEATCTEDGHSAYQECEVCGTTQNKEVYPAAHQFENYKCTVCGARDSSCEHDNAVITVKKSTCTVAGSEIFECPDCGYEFVEALALAEHQEVDQSVPATCTTKGLVHKVCAVCGKDLQKYEVDMNDHINVNGQCAACGTTLCTHEHVTTETTASTCTQDGCKTETCASCGKVTTTYLPRAEHNYVNGVCSECGKLDQTGISSGSHGFTYDFQDIFFTE